MTVTESENARTGPTIQGDIRPDLRPSGVNHLAISTTNMKAQLTFWADVLGCPTKALYWMHGVENTFHGFVELSAESYVAFVQHPENSSEIQYGVTHAGTPGSPVTGGATQHIALHVDTLDDVLAMRDRIRSNGLQVMGPIDHGFCKSIYFAGLEGMSLEVCCGRAIDERQWIDPEVQGLCGISPEELAALTSPSPLAVGVHPVPQPETDPTKPQMHYPTKVYEAIMGRSDGDMWTGASETTPPVILSE
ncbi:MAG: catechol 2,3-dioxygenase-like lactoylglutathione lyase family enzyme [Acidimicrobiales bacterium]|jgi:catechol 2,3-dioxygenase-like lactoylglutathione lyase family enzyme